MSTNATLETGIPRKVLAHASMLGVHPDCLSSGIEHACAPCKHLVNLSFDHFYAHCENEHELIGAITDDWLADVGAMFA